jgi:hypothetical protein
MLHLLPDHIRRPRSVEYLFSLYSTLPSVYGMICDDGLKSDLTLMTVEEGLVLNCEIVRRAPPEDGLDRLLMLIAWHYIDSLLLLCN